MKFKLKDESGMTLIESMIAMVIMLAGLLVMAQVLAFCVIASKTYGRDAGQTTTAARDKMEELIGLRFADTNTNVTMDAHTSNGKGLLAGGSIYPSAALPGYSDHIDFDGNRTPAGTAELIRQWRIVDDSSTLKTITVSVRSVRSFDYGMVPSTIMVTHKTP